MDKPDVAIIVSIASAAFTAGSLFYTRILAKNDSARMRRREPIFEIGAPRPWSHDSDWMFWDIICRNVEIVSIRVTGARCKTRSGLIVHDRDAYEDVNGKLGREVQPKRPPETRKAKFEIRVGPAGSVQSQFGTSPGETAWFNVLTKNVTDQRQIEFSWEWADGKPR